MKNTVGSRSVGVLAVLALVVAWASGCGGGKSEPKQAPDLDADQKARVAQSYLTAGRTSDALTNIDEAINLEPSKASLHHFRGLILFQAGRYDDAESAFLEALELDPFYTDAHNFLGAVYSEQKRYREAENEFSIALKDPSYPTPEKAHLNLALLYIAEGRDVDAIRNLRRAVELNPRYYRAHFELATALERQGSFSEAAREYEVAEPGYLRSGDYFYRRGLTYFRLGEKHQARQSLLRAIDVSPGSESASLSDELLKLLE